jgi:hypothetical protein
MLITKVSFLGEAVFFLTELISTNFSTIYHSDPQLNELRSNSSVRLGERDLITNTSANPERDVILLDTDVLLLPRFLH